MILSAGRSITTCRLLMLLGLSLALFFGPNSPATAQPNRELLLGIEPEHNIFDQMENYRKLAAFLSENLGIEVKLTIMSRYGEVLKRFKSLHLDGAFLNSYTAALAMRELQLVPVARPVTPNGEDITRSYIFARRDSGIKTAADMKGRSIAFVDPATIEGYIFPLSWLRRNGVGDPSDFFEHRYFTGSHASTISAVLDGRADIGATKNTAFNEQVARDPSIGHELTILAESPPLPETSLCLKEDLPAELRERISEILLNMDSTPEGRRVLTNIKALRFTGATREDYRLVFQLNKEAGLAGPEQ